MNCRIRALRLLPANAQWWIYDELRKAMKEKEAPGGEEAPGGMEAGE